MAIEEPSSLSPSDEKRLLWITVIVALVFILILTTVSFAIWPYDDDGRRHWRPERGVWIMFVPVNIFEWAFAGAMVSVLYRLAYRRRLQRVGLELYTWIVAKPFIGAFMGSLVYFVALAAAKLLEAQPEALNKALWLNVVAFVGGFSDELSIGLIRKFVARRLGLQDRGDKDGA
jgi:hypothetical protein